MTDNATAREIKTDFAAWLTQYVGPTEPLRLLEREIDKALITAHAEGVEAMRERAAGAALSYLDQFEEPDSHIISAQTVANEIAAAIHALPIPGLSTREGIVRWLRLKDEPEVPATFAYSLDAIADAIERCEDLKDTP